MKSSKWRQLCVWVRIPNSNVGGKTGCLNMVGYGSYLQVGNDAKLK